MKHIFKKEKGPISRLFGNKECKCTCDICKISRELTRIQNKYKMKEKDIKCIEYLWCMWEEASTDLGMLRGRLEDAGIDWRKPIKNAG